MNFEQQPTHPNFDNRPKNNGEIGKREFREFDEFGIWSDMEVWSVMGGDNEGNNGIKTVQEGTKEIME